MVIRGGRGALAGLDIRYVNAILEAEQQVKRREELRKLEQMKQELIGTNTINEPKTYTK